MFYVLVQQLLNVPVAQPQGAALPEGRAVPIGLIAAVFAQLGSGGQDQQRFIPPVDAAAGTA